MCVWWVKLDDVTWWGKDTASDWTNFGWAWWAPKLDDAPPDHFLKTGSFMWNYHSHCWHGKKNNIFGCLKPYRGHLHCTLTGWFIRVLCSCSPIFAVAILNILLSWVDCPNILSLDYSSHAEGSATGPPLPCCSPSSNPFPFPLFAFVENNIMTKPG